MKFLLGTIAYNAHIQNIALALHEAGLLAEYYTGGADHFNDPLSREIRTAAGRFFPPVEHRLARRRVLTVPPHLVHSDWRWEAPRIVSKQLRMGTLVEDWIWHRGEYHFARKCSHLIRSPRFDGFFGAEFGSLESLRTAKSLGKTTVVAFLSPHHRFREEWVDSEYERLPGLRTSSAKRLMLLARKRDRRKDSELEIADLVHTGSEFVAQSLIRAGVPRERIIVVPLGCPEVVNSEAAGEYSKPLRFICSGSLAVHKGTFYLLEAWKRLSPSSDVELHFYGRTLLPESCFRNLGSNVILHGPVPPRELFAAYESSAALIFPTLFDGFGMVAAEALAHGLPVIMTPNAGAADLIREGVNGFIVPPRDSDALAERIQWCIDHPAELGAMRLAAQDTARHWTWARFRASLREQLGQSLGITSEAK